MTNSQKWKTLSLALAVFLAGSMNASGADPVASAKDPRETVLLFSAKSDAPDKSIGRLFVGEDQYDVNRAHKYEPTKDSAAARNWNTYAVDGSGVR